MTTEMTVANLGDTVRDSVRKAMFDALPDSAIQQVIQNEFKAYFEEGTNQYNRERVKSPFAQMVQSKVQEILKERVHAQLLQHIDKLIDQNNPSDMLHALVEDCAPAVLAGLSKSIAHNVCESLRQGLMNGRF